MLCPNCRSADLIGIAKFDFCPECGSSFPRAQNIPSEIEHETSPQTLLQQSGTLTRGNSDHGVADKTQKQGKLVRTFSNRWRYQNFNISSTLRLPKSIKLFNLSKNCMISQNLQRVRTFSVSLVLRPFETESLFRSSLFRSKVYSFIVWFE